MIDLPKMNDSLLPTAIAPSPAKIMPFVYHSGIIYIYIIVGFISEFRVPIFGPPMAARIRKKREIEITN
jgi:hypothetical protein